MNEKRKGKRWSSDIAIKLLECYKDMHLIQAYE